MIVSTESAGNIFPCALTAASARSLTAHGFLQKLANATCVHLASVFITVTPVWYGWTTQDKASAALSMPQRIGARVIHVSL